jgi:hypothetical protein
MAQPVFYQTLNMVGIDPTLYYINTASVTPEYPAPPFIVGTQAFGSDGSQFVFVQASTSISLTDFVMITQGTAAGAVSTQSGFIANSLSTTNVASSVPVGIGSSGLVLKQSLSYIPAGAYFWALTRGYNVPAYTSGGSGVSNMATNAGSTYGVYLFTSATTVGVLTSITLSSNAAFVGIVCVNSLTTSIPSSIVPAVGNALSGGYVLGPVVNINNARPVIIPSSTGGNDATASATYSLPITGF